MKINFSTSCHTDWGQQIYVTGSHPELGSWDTDKARLMSYFPGDEWKIEIDFPAGKNIEFEYKYIIKHDNGFLLWEGGNNRRFSSNLNGTIELRDTLRKPSDPDNIFSTSAFFDVIFRHEKLPVNKKPSKTTLRLQVVTNRIDPEHILCVTGSISALGKWNIGKAVPMDNSLFPLWTLNLPLKERNMPFNYNYIIKDKNNKLILKEDGDERIFKNGKDTHKNLTIVTDNKFMYPKKWKGAGIAIPVFSLRSENGLGVGEFLDLKPLTDWTNRCGFQLIQLLPVNDTSVNMSWMDSYPYSCISVFALHPLYLNLPAIGSLPKNMLEEIDAQKKILNALPHLDYEKIMDLKLRFLREIFLLKKKKFLSSPEFQKFFHENSFWLKPYAAFCFLRDKYKTSEYKKWEKYSIVKEEDINAITSAESPDYNNIAIHYFIQYHLHLQLLEASQYAKLKRVVLKGDIPIGIHKHSVPCWTQPELFHMDQSAGAPPDPFSDVGQNWGFPTYNWDAMAHDNYTWWRNRLQKMSEYFQMIRLDHILGFFRIWEIPEYNISGLMGHFNPAIPLWKDELERQGIWDFNRLCDPFIPAWLVKIMFGQEAGYVIDTYLEEYIPGQYRLKPEFNAQKQIEAHLALPEDAPKDQKMRNEWLKNELFTFVANIVFFRDPNRPGFHPRINLMDTASFACLEGWVKEKLRFFYQDYFYRRQDDFWRQLGMIKLPVLKTASNMLICGEDLGMIPYCVPLVMEELCIVGLRIQRMPKEMDREFGNPKQYPYLTVCSTGSHDMPTIRGWWEEDRARTERYYKNLLGHSGDAPLYCEPKICREIIKQHLESASMWAVFPIQDILGMSEELHMPGDPHDEQINNPANPRHLWKFRLHITLEKLNQQKEFSKQILKMVTESGRHSIY